MVLSGTAKSTGNCYGNLFLKENKSLSSRHELTPWLRSLFQTSDDEKIVIQPLLYDCVSNKTLYWTVATYAWKGTLLIFGIFLTWQTKSVILYFIFHFIPVAWDAISFYNLLNENKKHPICIYTLSYIVRDCPYASYHSAGRQHMSEILLGSASNTN